MNRTCRVPPALLCDLPTENVGTLTQTMRYVDSEKCSQFKAASNAFLALKVHIWKVFPLLQVKGYVLPSNEESQLIRSGTLGAGLVRLLLPEHDLLALYLLFYAK